jgi:hypothetical protein
MSAANRQYNSRRRRAFTLVEMVTSCLIMSIIMVALGYGLKLALTSTGEGAAQAVASIDAADCVERITDDMTEASTFTEKTSQAVTFTVPDRNADGQTDKIRYAWWPSGGTYAVTSGSSGGGGVLGGLLSGVTNLLGGGTTQTTYTIPANVVTRQLNDGVPAVLSRDVRSFNLNYLYRTMSPPAPPTEKLLWQHDPALLGTNRDYNVDFSKWIAESFLPSTQLPGGTTSFSISRISLYLKADLTYESIVRVSVRGVNAATNAPTAVIYDSASVPEVSFNDTYGWVDFNFSNLAALNPSTKYAIVIEGISGSTIYGIANYVQSSLNIPPIATNTWMVITTNRGSTWTNVSGSAMRYRIYGNTLP